MEQDILQQPIWLQAWIFWLVVVNTAAILFIRRVPARWVIAAWLVNIPLMSWLYAEFGYQRILGLSHVLVWTPLLAYLYHIRDQWDMSTLTGKWLAVLFATNLISLAIDYVDVARYLLGG